MERIKNTVDLFKKIKDIQKEGISKSVKNMLFSSVSTIL